METTKHNKITYEQKLEIQKQVSDLDFSETEELFKLIKSETNKYTTNKNGAFINMRNLDNNVLWKILDFIKYCKETKKSLEHTEKIRKGLFEKTMVLPTFNTLKATSIINVINPLDNTEEIEEDYNLYQTDEHDKISKKKNTRYYKKNEKNEKKK